MTKTLEEIKGMKLKKGDIIEATIIISPKYGAETHPGAVYFSHLTEDKLFYGKVKHSNNIVDISGDYDIKSISKIRVLGVKE